VTVVVDLMRPDPDHIRCNICFKLCTFEELAVDKYGDRWDVCTGQCAVEAGIEER